MSKLLQGKKWFTIEDTVTYVASEIGESVCESDIFDLVARDSLILSVNIIERSYAEIGKVVDDVFDTHIDTCPLPMLSGFWEKIRSGYVSGLWDIVNGRGSKEIFEKKYYHAKEGYNGGQTTNNWLFINHEDGRVCKLLVPESFDDYDGCSVKYYPACDFPEGFQFVVLKHRIDKLINELNSQKKLNDKPKPFSERERNSHIILISALLHVIYGKDGVECHPDFGSESQLIQHLTETYGDCGEGLSRSTLEKRFTAAKQVLPM